MTGILQTRKKWSGELFLNRKCLFCKPSYSSPQALTLMTKLTWPRFIHILSEILIACQNCKNIEVPGLFYIFLKLTRTNLYLITEDLRQVNILPGQQSRLSPNSLPDLVNLLTSRENYCLLLCWSLGCFAKLHPSWLVETTDNFDKSPR